MVDANKVWNVYEARRFAKLLERLIYFLNKLILDNESQLNHILDLGYNNANVKNNDILNYNWPVFTSDASYVAILSGIIPPGYHLELVLDRKGVPEPP